MTGFHMAAKAGVLGSFIDAPKSFVGEARIHMLDDGLHIRAADGP